ncbi:DUF1836 domain-containing protein [Mesobacillus maritimus]|uniref:DUF1836 domain-containing protein n=1 Tax=Mesobacillus maritimus TaxID=1643336 RepID=UPI00203D4B59|nr:DUF1836 domain-containing protein [Mesobacillus maritimus]MCM3585640.1 DUF1836 domain-containing protein [Mesobacillus maritimus]MCM3669112.1 DUF1836 domain-containing protein [Mesobacillus maritimus]
MKEWEELVNGLDSKQNILIENIPSIDLYMDQVIQLFEKTFADSKRTEEEKILTKTMINNYAKGKLFFPVKNKKYTNDHIMLISLIYQLKGALSITEIKGVLNGLNEKVVSDDFDLEEFYQSYLNLFEKNTEDYKINLKEKVADAVEEVDSGEKDGEYLQTVLLIASLVSMSNLYRRTAEKLVDDLTKG